VPNLYDQNFADRDYTDEQFLKDVRELIAAEQREGTRIDYKGDISNQDNWQAAVASFANTFGGLIVFGMETNGDLPTNLSGFVPKGETSMRLTNAIVSRVQPRPEFSIRVSKLNTDPLREVAVLRVAEGWNTPYMYSKDGEHRIYLRAESRKSEADYLQLRSLFEKGRSRQVRTEEMSRELTEWKNVFYVTETPTAPRSTNMYRFVILPQQHLNLQLDLSDEKALRTASGYIYKDALRNQGESRWTRTPRFSFVDHETHAEIVPGQTTISIPKKWGLSTTGAIGFASVIPRLEQQPKPSLFFPDFLFDWICFFLLAGRYYASRSYYGNALFEASVEMASAATVSFEPLVYAIDFNSTSDICFGANSIWNGGASATNVIDFGNCSAESLARIIAQSLNVLVRHFGGTLRKQGISILKDMISSRIEMAKSPDLWIHCG
jgi:Putative DNA-binding domain